MKPNLFCFSSFNSFRFLVERTKNIDSYQLQKNRRTENMEEESFSCHIRK